LIRNLNILLIGRIGAGKSSFINTLKSTFAGKWKAEEGYGNDPKSFTKILKLTELFAGKSI
jgi:predicted GTPase